MNKIKILGIVGSLRQDSYNAFALKAAQALVPNDVALELIDLHGIPLYSQDNEMSPPSAIATPPVPVISVAVSCAGPSSPPVPSVLTPRSLMMTEAPSAANSFEIDWPIPRPPPVMIATRPSSMPMSYSSSMRYSDPAMVHELLLHNRGGTIR